VANTAAASAFLFRLPHYPALAPYPQIAIVVCTFGLTARNRVVLAAAFIGSLMALTFTLVSLWFLYLPRGAAVIWRMTRIEQIAVPRQ
jgi:hypothetical protein